MRLLLTRVKLRLTETVKILSAERKRCSCDILPNPKGLVIDGTPVLLISEFTENCERESRANMIKILRKYANRKLDIQIKA